MVDWGTVWMRKKPGKRMCVCLPVPYIMSQSVSLLPLSTEVTLQLQAFDLNSTAVSAGSTRPWERVGMSKAPSSLD